MRNMNSWIVWAGVCVSAFFASAANIVPASFNYQGVLRDGAGNELDASAQTIEFRLYENASGGDFCWGRSYQVLLSSNGLFNVELSDASGTLLDNSKTELLPNVISENPSLYLGLTVSGASEISPRQQLLSVPYALVAGDSKRASGDFSVADELRVGSGIQAVDGTITASNMVLSSEGSEATMNVNSNGNLSVGNLDVSGSITAGSITGSTDIQGETELFSRNARLNEFVKWDGGTTPHYLLGTGNDDGAVSDGFFVMNVYWHFYADSDNEDNDMDMEIHFSGSGNDRSFYVKLRGQDLGGNNGRVEKKDVVSLPVLKGESVSIKRNGEYHHHDDSSLQYKYMFIPFGTKN